MWKAFMCHNLGADQTADPFTPSWRLNGHYYQWGRAAVAANGPSGSGSTQANAGAITGWNTTAASNGAWTDGSKTANDPCPSGFRVPTQAQWDAVLNTSLNPTSSYLGTWSSWPGSSTNYSAGLRIGSGTTGLFLPAAGDRSLSDGTLYVRGLNGHYWSSTENGGNAWFLYFNNGNAGTNNFSRTFGMSVRCVADVVSAASSTPTLCINTSLTPITHTTEDATGIGAATDLPPGVSAAWAANTITISGTPTGAGVFNYSIPLTGGSGGGTATGTITVTAENTAGAASSTPTLEVNTALPPITHTTTGASGIGTPTGLPAGVSAAWASNTITISGTPTAAGTYNYSIPLTGGCGSVSATGTITVNVAPTANCGAYVASGVWKTFKCHNLGADESADPFTPSWRLNGHYYQWGRAAVAAAGPTGSSSGEANAGAITGWNTTAAPNGAWTDGSKTANDPCPAGFRVPTWAQWFAVLNTSLNPSRSYPGSWSSWPGSSTNFSAGLRIGSGTTGLFLPAAGNRIDGDGTLFNRGNYGHYWSSTENGSLAWYLNFGSGDAGTYYYGTRTLGMSVRCVAE